MHDRHCDPVFKAWLIGHQSAGHGLLKPGGISIAAGWKNWTWKRYRIKFKLPRSWKVTKNNRNSFIAKGPGAVMKIGPWRGRSATARSVATKALNSYSIIRNRRVLRRKTLRKGNSGLNRYMLYGKAKYNGRGSSNGKPVRFGIVGMPVSLIATVVVSLMTEEPDAETQAMVDEVRDPTGPTILSQEH